MTAMPAEDGPKIVGKAELAATLGWGRERLDRRILSDPDFPIVKRASKGVPWEFDLDEVRAYLAENEAKPKASAEQTPRARRETAMAVALEDKNRRERGELVEREAMRTALTTAMARMGKNFDGAPETIARRLSLTDDEMEIIRSILDECRRSAVEDLREVLTDD